MAQHHIKAVGVLLHHSQEGEPGELGQAGPTNRWPEAEIAELLEALPAGHALVLFQCIIPSLGRADQMIRSEPDMI